MHGTFATRKQSKQFFLEQLSPSDFSLSGFPTSKPAPTPFPLYSAISSRSVQAQLKWVRLLASTGPGIAYLQNKSVLPFFIVFFIHLSHTTLNLLNCPILWQQPSSLFLKQNFLLSTTDVDFTSHPAHLTPALDKLVEWPKKVLFQFPFGITHCWGLVALWFPPTCPLLVWGLLRSRC